jgi:glycosyltransferase involved in cell wall biosynthesis
MARRVAEILDEERPDIFHSSTIEDLSPYSWKVASQRGIPVVHTLRAYGLMCPSATMFKRGANCAGQCRACRYVTTGKRLLSAHVTAAIGISHAVLETHLNAGYFGNAQRTVIRNIFDVPREFAVVEQVQSPLRLGFIGRMEEIKGLGKLLKALDLARIGPALELRIAGSGTQELGVIGDSVGGSKIVFLGWVKPEDFYPTVDVIVVPSLWREPLGRVVFEAYAFGVPVVGSNRGGIPEIIEPGKTGFIFDPDSPTELSEILRRLAADPQQLRSARLNCMRKAQEFSAPRIGSQHRALYEELLSERRSPRE